MLACYSTVLVTRLKTNSPVGDIGTMYDFHDSTDTLKFWTEKRAINKTFLFFIWFWWNLVKLLLSRCTTISPSFIKVRWKTKKDLLIAQNFKVSVELWKLYIVHRVAEVASRRKIEKSNFQKMLILAFLR